MSHDSSRPRDVFLSYSSRDKAWSDAACAVLERHGIRCWIAPRDITPGEEWGAEIIRGINGSRIMVLIFSAHANASGQVRREVERAISAGLPVLPIRVEDVRPEGSMEYALGNTHWLDAFAPPVEKQLERIARSVKTLLGDDVAANAGRPKFVTTDSGSRERADPAPGTALRPRRSLRWAVGVALFVMAMIVTGSFMMFGDGTVSTIQPTANPAPRSDEDRIQGRWQVITGASSKNQGKNTDLLTSKTVWTFQGTEMTNGLLVDGREEVKNRGTFSLSSGGDRKLFDFMTTNPGGRPIEFSGIYEFEGESLRVCYWIRLDPANNPDFERPDSFAVGPGTRRIYLKFGRAGD